MIVLFFYLDSRRQWFHGFFTGLILVLYAPVRFGLEAYYSVVKPDDVVGTAWDFRFYMIPAVPSALFKWMQ